MHNKKPSPAETAVVDSVLFLYLRVENILSNGMAGVYGADFGKQLLLIFFLIVVDQPADVFFERDIAEDRKNVRLKNICLRFG